MKQKSLVLALFALATIAIILGVIDHYVAAINSNVLAVSRWLLWGSMIYFAYQRKKLTTWIVVAMMLGCEIGFSFPTMAAQMDIFSGIFLRLIKTIIAPLIFSTLVVGIAAHSNLKQVGRMGLKAILYFEVVTTLALCIGLAAINISRAGEGADIQVAQAQEQKAEKMLAAKKPAHDVILDIFPENIAKAIADGQVLQVVVFSILFASGLALVKDDKKKPVLQFMEGLSEVMFKFTNIVMYVAPFAVCGALAYSIATFGFEVLKNLIMLVATLYAALFVFIVAVLVPIGLIIKLNFRKFINAVAEPVTIAFSTATSESALPKAMENLEAMGIPRKVVSFVLPTGYSFNLDGSTLYLSLASVFVAQMAGVDLSLGEQIKMVVILMLTSKGVAGVRGATFLILVATVADLGIDPHKAFVVLGVDAIMDMARTGTNVLGNCLATVVVAKWEGEYKD
ncbi:MAG TPA: cation:dicarboxylase symporter family transporter [Cyclobacteriaceae bacterium]|nr:cation:dicarboxylase symporter family transporter [Cyclobacteriaceae bacterium]